LLTFRKLRYLSLTLNFSDGVPMRRLPYLNGIKAFEAAGRHGSFAAAAQELHVSPAAISRMVQLLEHRLGLSLFERQANRLRLTAAGQTYQRGLAQVFDTLESLTDQVTAKGGGRVLTVGVGPTFAIRWLIPRLAALSAAAPGLDVRITTGGAAAPFADDWTCGIKLGDGDWPGLAAELLFAADMRPVCTPALARRLGDPGDLAQAPLLRVAHAAEDWPTWCRHVGVPDVTATGPMFEYYGHALQAALDGLGIAMGLRPYIDDDLAAGRLVAPFPVSVPKQAGWYLIYRPFRRQEAAFAAFRDWIMSAARSGQPAPNGVAVPPD
jgi:LysR family glycine cleavage system transcriptional activator